jgi:hypothetical protein
VLKRALVAFSIFAVAPAAAPAAVILTAAEVAEPPAGGSESDKAERVAAAAEGEKAKPKSDVPGGAGWTGSLIALAALGYAVRRRPAEVLPQSV